MVKLKVPQITSNTTNFVDNATLESTSRDIQSISWDKSYLITRVNSMSPVHSKVHRFIKDLV